MVNTHHIHDTSQNQCGSNLVQTIDAPISLVWAILRRFDEPQAYKNFIKSCTMFCGSGGIGSVRDVKIISGLPATSSRERLDKLDDELHIMMVSIIGGDHRLSNYHSTTTLHETEGGLKTVVTESYVVDVPAENSKEDTCTFADTIIGSNLRSLARVTQNMFNQL
ncbi:hypothetical protein Patl1_10509 [Pistacia atlantica]|uniref:Uncharacterized protein n=1 Tax=Pistacia atlantica TaxID=434234 RepID=A0ACC1A8D5_9ROSI|nr:hypothetical protein Patl1_10509 [Pistacia atlantica]